MHCNKIEEFMEIIIGWENIKEIILGVILKPRGLPWGQGVCQMIILLHYLHSKSGHLGGGGLNFPKKWARGLWMASRVVQILRSCRGGPCQGAKFECGFKFLL